MTPEQAISNLKEIIKLSRNEINKKNENLTAILDLTDLQSLDIVLYMLKNQKERIDYLTRSIERKEQSLIEEHEENIECYTMLEKKEKIIDLMSEQLAGLAIFNIDKDETLILGDKEEVKQYFEDKAKEK